MGGKYQEAEHDGPEAEWLGHGLGLQVGMEVLKEEWEGGTRPTPSRRQRGHAGTRSFSPQ